MGDPGHRADEVLNADERAALEKKIRGVRLDQLLVVGDAAGGYDLMVLTPCELDGRQIPYGTVVKLTFGSRGWVVIVADG